MKITYTLFYKNEIILAEPQYSYCFSKFQTHLFLYCSCDNCTHMYVYHQRGLFWLVMAVLYFNTQIRVYHILYTDGTIETMLQLKILMTQTFFYCEVSSKLVCILFIYCSVMCQVSIDLIYFSPSKFFWVFASSLVIVLQLFLIFG